MENVGKNLDSIGQFVDLMQRNVMYVENLALSVQALHEQQSSLSQNPLGKSQKLAHSCKSASCFATLFLFCFVFP